MAYCDKSGKNRDRDIILERLRLAPLIAAICSLCFLLAGCDLSSTTAIDAESNQTAEASPGASASATAGSRLAVVTTNGDGGAGINTPASYSYTEVVDTGPQVLDPALARDRASKTIVRNVMETLVYPDPRERGNYVPLLATDWRITNQGRTYTFSIRRGVRFSNGNPLTASDISYSLQRVLLASPLGGPQHLLLEPLLAMEAPETITDTTGVVPPSGDMRLDIVSGIDEGIYSGDRAALLANVPAETLLTICQELQAAITANDGDGTLTIQLSKPWAPLLSVMSQTWTSAVDRQWAIERGAWDGRCETWQNWYALDSDESTLATAILGTGPYILDYWVPGTEYVLAANEAYWRGENPMWLGGPSAAPDLDMVRVQQVDEANARWQLLESGAAHTASLSRAGSLLARRQTSVVCDWLTAQCETTDGEEGPLRRVENIPQDTHQALFFNFAIVAEDNEFLGSGQLDGEGIPPDFFDDVHVRKAFAYCMDDRAFVDAAMSGEGILPQGLLPWYLFGPAAVQNGDYPYLLQRCTEELALAFEGQLPNTGFRLQLPFESGDAADQAAAVLLQNSLRAVNPSYQLEAIGLPAPLLQQAVRERRAPLALLTWTPELPDPYYWVAPAFGDESASFQRLPRELQSTARVLLAKLLTVSDPAARQQLYDGLDQFYEESMPFVLLAQPAMAVYQQRELDTWLYNAADPLPYYYSFALR